jgi:hypothetical protein
MIPPPDGKTTTPAPGGASLKICLQLPDETTFLGRATVRLTSDQGHPIVGEVAAFDGNLVFPDVSPGKYALEVAATGYKNAQLSAEVEAGRGQRTVFVVMQPQTLPDAAEKVPAKVPVATAAAPAMPQVASALLAKPAPAAEPDYWTPGGLESFVPSVDPNITCPTDSVLKGASQRMSEFVGNLEKFTAKERVEHFRVKGEKVLEPPEVRKFDYMVFVSQNKVGTFLLDEYRDGLDNSYAFPAHIATHGLPALALLFHPEMAKDFQFVCEGFGQTGGHPAWQVHFKQRADRPIRMRAYIVNGSAYSVQMEGRAWIDPGSFQVLRLESEMAKSIPQIQLTQEHIIIEYAPVQFRTQNIQIWLPSMEELYVERHEHRYFRRHSFTNFEVFSVDTTQTLQAPKESYSFTNLSDSDISGVLTVEPEEGAKQKPVTLSFTVPARGKVFKVVGPGKDVNLPVTEVASATFSHNGPDGAIKVDAFLAKETILDVIPESAQ